MSRADQPSLPAKLLAACLAVSYLLAVVMAVCPALHHLAHHHADESTHHCAVTAVIDGQVDSSPVAPVDRAYLPRLMGMVDFSVAEPSLPIFLAAFALEHAPPAV